MFLSISIVDPIVKWMGSSWLAEINIGSIIVRLLLAFVFAGTIGLERAIKKHAAGLRTYILVCVASCLAMMADAFLVEAYSSGDPARFGAQVISGIGFLGAGTILVTSRNQVKGLTTAAGLWAVACLGITIGAGLYTAAIIGYILIGLSIFFMPKLEMIFTKKSGCYELHIEFDQRANLKEFVSLIRDKGLKIVSVEHNPAYASSGLSVYTIMISIDKEKKYKNHNVLIDEIKALPYVEYVEEML
ncbi:MAG: MgtC/SapB family protein [Bacilli bacterium]|nr:MgtC/SapB family protein [Bacillales bacterium]MDY2575690.1 MgtC/SapB family protein [Bacilli bacterium]